MEGLAKIDAIYIAIVFLVPGYVFLSLRNQFVVGQGKLGKEQLLTYLTISGVNFALCGWIVYAAYANNFGVPLKTLSWLLVTILIPAAAGMVFGVCNQRDYVRRLFQYFDLTPSHAIPSAWDYKFSRSAGEWVLVKLKDGTQFAGWWAGRSFASDDRTERDLLIEQVFEVPDSGPWISTCKSLLIMAGEIQTIEFTPEGRTETHDEATDRNSSSDPLVGTEGASAPDRERRSSGAEQTGAEWVPRSDSIRASKPT
jgi:hypothetical protein